MCRPPRPVWSPLSCTRCVATAVRPTAQSRTLGQPCTSHGHWHLSQYHPASIALALIIYCNTRTLFCFKVETRLCTIGIKLILFHFRRLISVFASNESVPIKERSADHLGTLRPPCFSPSLSVAIGSAHVQAAPGAAPNQPARRPRVSGPGAERRLERPLLCHGAVTVLVPPCGAMSQTRNPASPVYTPTAGWRGRSICMYEAQYTLGYRQLTTSDW